MTEPPTLEQAVRWAVGLHVRPTRKELYTTVAALPGAFSQRRIREMLETLEKSGVLRVESSEVCFRSRRDLHQAAWELVDYRPGLFEQKLSPEPWYSTVDSRRLKVYLNQPLQSEDSNWARAYWLPPWDLEFFLSRRPEVQASLLSSLRSDFWFEGIWGLELGRSLATLDTGNQSLFLLELALLQGDLAEAERLLNGTHRRLGYGSVLQFIQGQTTLAYEGFVKRIARRRPDAPALPPLVATFARLAAYVMRDLAMLGDRRLCTGVTCLDQFFYSLAHHLKGQPVKSARWEGLGLGLSWTCLWAVRESLPQPPTLPVERSAWLQQHGLMALDNPPWADHLRPRASWRCQLDRLRQEGRIRVTTTSPKVGGELWWEIRPEGLAAGWRVDGELQAVHLRELRDHHLEPLDRLILQDWNRGSTNAALRALRGHRRVLFEGRETALEIRHPHLRLLPTSQGFRLELTPLLHPKWPYRLEPQAHQVVHIYVQADWHESLAAIVNGGIEIPFDGEDDLRQSLAPWLDRVELEYAPGVRPLAEVVRQGEVVAQLRPHRSGLHLSWIWRLPVEGPGMPLLVGPARESLNWNGRTLIVVRNFEEEARQLQSLLARCPQLPDRDESFGTLEEALELVRLLQTQAIPSEWPEGKAWKVHPKLGASALRLKVSGLQDWFQVSGQLQIDEKLVLQLQRSLELARLYPGRYWRLSDEDFVEVSEQLCQQLQSLDELLEEGQLPALAAPCLEELGVPLEAGADFRLALARLAALQESPPPLPDGLRAQLRDYQVEGYQWLAQRAEAGVGACLADDMGLGKTLQVIALLAQRSWKGAALVVCPTSVVDNWREQIERFAPHLKVVLLGPRQELLPAGIHLCSYRRLLSDRKALSEHAWDCVILDEAQAIKNSHSQTARAAFQVSASAHCRVATTGTPIENRLVELWSLFRFLNPALLGPLTAFRQRYEKPAGHGLSAGQLKVKARVRPFLLRRLKSQVLQQLPPRTEIVVRVELSESERALYEALRIEANQDLEEQGKRFEVLAHLTRLRQVCCHPRLILPQQEALTSSKLEAFLELALDLRAGDHQCLVFSQFTRLLDLLEVRLKQHSLSYLRLDGSTPGGQRGELVREFQKGQTDLFLISLKAGGTGLNLTAADYVVHLDPWWNPAVEDQASDRVHRLGQERPVTVYRLVARGTLEEKVLRLHQGKRQLAEQMLAGAEMAQAIGLQDLRDLLS